MSSNSLTQAVTSGDVRAVSAALSRGAEVNGRTGGGQTPLILATIFGHTHLIPLLLEAGADPHLQDNLGLNAIDWAHRRGATEAIKIFSNKRNAETTRRTEVPSLPSPPSPPVVTQRSDEKPASESADDRSRRWLAGVKQRIAEQSQREPVNILPPEPLSPPAPEPKPVNVLPPDLPPSPAPQPKPVNALPPEPLSPPAPEAKPVNVLPPDLPPSPAREAAPVHTPPPEPTAQSPEPKLVNAPSPERSTRKRCPKCNAIYDSPLVAYCAHHIVPLVDADAPIIPAEPPKNSPVMFWMIVVITLSGSIVVASLVTTYFYNTRQPAPEPAASSTAAPVPVQKGIPTVSRELTGRVVSLPVAECPLNGQEAIPGTVVVKVTVDNNGQVKSAQAKGGDWLLRDAATEAAMKSTFAAQKLRGRQTEGTITYTFQP